MSYLRYNEQFLNGQPYAYSLAVNSLYLLKKLDESGILVNNQLETLNYYLQHNHWNNLRKLCFGFLIYNNF